MAAHPLLYRRSMRAQLGTLALTFGTAVALVASRPLPVLATALELPSQAAVAAPAEAASDSVPATKSLEDQIITLVNADRVTNGLSPVAYDPALLDTAETRALDQVSQPTLNHYAADGRLAFVRLLSNDGVTYKLAGENLARTSGWSDDTAADIEAALMSSPTHRANILEPTFTGIAVGATVDNQGRVIVTQIFRNA
jgi:uncharacterized protein YkwD